MVGAWAAERQSSGSKRPSVPPACQNRTVWPSTAPERTAAMTRGQRLGRVDRVDEDRLGAGEELGRLGGGRRRPPVAVAELGLRRARCRRRAGRPRRRQPPARRPARAIAGRQLGRRTGDDDADDPGRRRSLGRPRRPARPGSRRSPIGRTIGIEPDARRGRLVERLAQPPGPARSRRRRRSRRPSIDVRPPPGRPQHPRRRRRPAPRARLDRPSASWWTVAPNACASRTPGPGGSTGGPDRTRWTSSPARAPAAAVSRQWFDQRRPLVTSVSAPSASAAPTRNSRLRSLLPPNASGSRSSRFIQMSTRPPSASAKPRQPMQGRRAVESGNRGRSDAVIRAPYHRGRWRRASPRPIG